MSACVCVPADLSGVFYPLPGASRGKLLKLNRLNIYHKMTIHTSFENGCPFLNKLTHIWKWERVGMHFVISNFQYFCGSSRREESESFVGICEWFEYLWKHYFASLSFTKIVLHKWEEYKSAYCVNCYWNASSVVKNCHWI